MVLYLPLTYLNFASQNVTSRQLQLPRKPSFEANYSHHLLLPCCVVLCCVCAYLSTYLLMSVCNVPSLHFNISKNLMIQLQPGKSQQHRPTCRSVLPAMCLLRTGKIPGR